MPYIDTARNLFKQMQSAMLSPDELVWWMAELESYHPMVELSATQILEEAASFERQNWNGWKVCDTTTEYIKGTVSSAGLDFETRRGSHDRTFFLTFIVMGRRSLLKVYLNHLLTLKECYA